MQSRLFARWLHIAVGVTNMIYVYTPLHDVPGALTIVKWINFPVLAFTGVWLILGGRIWFDWRRKVLRPS